jgi:hypothetical protein
MPKRLIIWTHYPWRNPPKYLNPCHLLSNPLLHMLQNFPCPHPITYPLKMAVSNLEFHWKPFMICTPLQSLFWFSLHLSKYYSVPQPFPCSPWPPNILCNLTHAILHLAFAYITVTTYLCYFLLRDQFNCHLHQEVFHPKSELTTPTLYNHRRKHESKWGQRLVHGFIHKHLSSC